MSEISRNDLTQEYIQSILNYDKKTGIFTWKERVDVAKGWNPKYAGKEAGRKSKNKRVEININGVLYLANRLAWVYITGEWPSRVIDHKDLDFRNNAFENLRQATVSENGQNARVRSHSKTQVKGVGYVCRDGIWYYRARITIRHKEINLGYFHTIEDAQKAYQQASKKYHPRFGRSE